MINKALLTKFLLNPITDKVFGFIAYIPFFYSTFFIIYGHIQGHFNPYFLALAAHNCLVLVLLLIRRPATRVSLNPIHWFITFARNYWGYLLVGYAGLFPTVSLVSPEASGTLLLIAIAIFVYARISLGRSFGFVPAHRGLVTTGAYGLVRHPIHTGQFIFLTSFLVSYYSLANAVLLLVGLGFVVVKSIIEERFLMQDPEYVEYAKKVPYRWIPRVI